MKCESCSQSMKINFDQTKRTWGNFIYKVRWERRMSQADLASKLGVARVCIYRWETNRNSPRLNDVTKHLGMLGVKFSEYAEWIGA